MRGGVAIVALHSLLLCLAIFALPVKLSAATFAEDFSTNPNANGWQIFGNTNLFHWDSTNQNLRVTWDSSQTNSYFHRPLGTILTSDDDFSLSFDLTLEDYVIGITPGKDASFEIAIGLLNLEQATRTNFFRGAGVNSSSGPRDLVEFNFFPAWDVFLPTIAQAIVATNNQWLFNHDNLYELTPGETFHIAMIYAALNRTLTTVLTNNGVQFGLTQTITVPDNFDFRVATLSINNYSDAGQSPLYAGSILAHGAVDNLVVVTPPQPVEDLTGQLFNGQWQTQFTSRTNWLYTLERTTDLVAWEAAETDTPGNGSTLTLTDTNSPAANVFYRVRANRP